MTRAELEAQLQRLDPGARLRVDERLLTGMFDLEDLTNPEALVQVEAFAMAHRCSFYLHDQDRIEPVFEKNDVF